jgi:hypothetical protein
LRITSPRPTEEVAVAVKITRPQSSGEHVAIRAQQLAFQPRLKYYDDILDHCCFAWNKLIDMPWKTMSIGRVGGPFLIVIKGVQTTAKLRHIN